MCTTSKVLSSAVLNTNKVLLPWNWSVLLIINVAISVSKTWKHDRSFVNVQSESEKICLTKAFLCDNDSAALTTIYTFGYFLSSPSVHKLRNWAQYWSIRTPE